MRAPAWTREQFCLWLRRAHITIVVDGPREVVRCRCGDRNCHGWRIVSGQGWRVGPAAGEETLQ